jgi:hypothetical protein
LYIFGIADGGEMNILGITLMRPYTWVFDRQNERIGFAPMTGCNVKPMYSQTQCSSSGYSSSGFFGQNSGTVMAFLQDERMAKIGIGGAVMLLGMIYVVRAVRKRNRQRGLKVARRAENDHDRLLPRHTMRSYSATAIR